MIKLIILLLSLTPTCSFITNQKVLKKSCSIINMSSNILLNNEELPAFSKFESNLV